MDKFIFAIPERIILTDLTIGAPKKVQLAERIIYQIITQAQADRMTQRGGRDMGVGMMNGSSRMDGGIRPCSGTGIPFGSGMQRGGRWQQNNP